MSNISCGVVLLCISPVCAAAGANAAGSLRHMGQLRAQQLVVVISCLLLTSTLLVAQQMACR